jgi:transposase
MRCGRRTDRCMEFIGIIALAGLSGISVVSLNRKNKYSNRARISEMKSRSLVKYYNLDIEAKKTAVLTGLNRNTVNRYYVLLRKMIARHCEAEPGWIDCDPDGIAQTGLRPVDGEPSDYRAVFVFGVLCRDGRVRAELVPLAHYAAAQVLLRAKSRLNTCGGLDKYEGLGDLSSGSFCRIRANGGRDEPSIRADKTSEQFWTFLKCRLMKFNGISRSSFYLHLKECEFWFNYRGEDLYPVPLKMVHRTPLGG